MHIGIDARLPYYHRGGISQYILYLIEALGGLSGSDCYEIFSSRKDDNDYIPEGRENFLPYKLWTPSHHRLERWTLGLEILPRRLDLFHSPDFIPPRVGVTKRVITVHDLNFLLFPKFVDTDSHQYYTHQINSAVNEADHIIADSHHTRQDIISILNVPAEKVTTVHLAANPIFSIPVAKEEIESTLEQLELPTSFILYVGTLSPRKNVLTLLESYYTLLQKTDVEVPLVLVGAKGFQYEEIFSSIDNLKLTSQVRHFEGLTNRTLARLYRAAGVFVLPSFYEGFGLPPLEAMHCGCPVIVSNRSSLPEVVGDAGLLVDPEDIDGWTRAIQQVLSDPQEREMLSKAGISQAKKFSWQMTAKETVKIYHSLGSQSM
jgi:glycosyltransferase involved in cell wall biosynthesis